MPRRFKESENPQKARTDWKKEQEARQPRRAPAGGRGGLLQNMMARRMGGGPGPGGGGPGGGLDAMRNHPAVGFGRQMTGGVADGPSAAIRNMVMQRLAQKGMSQDNTGTWQIAGLNRPSDPGLDIRNSAIAAMDPTGEMLRRVLGASPMPGGMRGMPSGLPGSGIPSPGLGAGSLPPGPQNGMPLPPVFPSGGPGMPGTSTTSTRPGTVNGMPVPPGGGMQSVPPGLPGGPPMPPKSGGLGAALPSLVPGDGGWNEKTFPPVAPPSGSPPFPPQGQGVGRETTPTGAEIDPTKYPPTGNGQGPGGANIIQNPSLGLPPAGSAGGLNQPAPSAPLGAPAQPRYIPTDAGGPAGQGGNGGLMSPPQPRYIPTDAGGPAGQGGNGMYPPVAALPPAGMAGGLNQAAPPPPAGNGQGPGGANIIQNPSPATSMPPPSVANDIYRQPGTLPPAPGAGLTNGASAPWVKNPDAGPPSQYPQGGAPRPMGQHEVMQNAQMQGFANPGSALTQRLQQGRPGTPSAPGRAPTPMVPAGAMPGQSTPFNPAQMAQQGMKLPAIPRPTQGAFGTPGQTQIPGARQPASLANLGNSIQQTVASRIGASQQGLRPGVSPATPGSPVGDSLDDLGERIRAAVAGNNGNVQPAAPGAGGTNLGQATTSIMDRVLQQLSQAGMPQGGVPQAPMSNGTTPFPTQNTSMTPGGPSTGTMPGGMPAPGGAPVPPGGAPPATTSPGPAGSGGLGSYGNASIDQWDSAFIAAGQKYGVDPASLKAIMDVETGGNGDYPITKCRGDDGTGVASCGPMQIKAIYHGGQAATVEDQIMQAARIISDYKNANPGATDRDALFAVYFTGDDPNGTSQSDYAVRFDQLVGQIGSSAPAAGGTTPAVDPTTGAPLPGGPTRGLPAPAGGLPTAPGGLGAPSPDPGTAGAITNAGMGGMEQKQINQTTPPAPGADATAPIGPQGGARIPVISGTLAEQPATDGLGAMATPDSDESYLEIVGAGTWVSTDYKQPVTWEVPALGDCPYCYQNGHGADGSTHAGMDIVNPGGYGASMATPVSGRVVCEGYGAGDSVPGWNCGYAIGPTFEDNNGPGQITLDIGTDAAGNQLIYNTIHMGGSTVKNGQMVNVGDQIGTQGAMDGMVHAHVETLAICDGNYIYLDPTLVVNGYYSTRSACG